MNSQNKQAARRFAAAFANSLTKSLTELTRGPIQCKVLDNAGAAMPDAQQVHYRLIAEDALRGECVVEFYESQIASLSSKMADNPPESTEDAHAEAVGRAISSAAMELTVAMSSEYGKLALKVDRVTNHSFDKSQVIPLSISGAAQSDISVSLYLDSQLMESLTSSNKNAVGTDVTQNEPVNLKLVMDVELNVSLRFGQRELPLREVLELTSGSVVELDSQVDEPVELLLDGKVIARGEAVIVDGNYGLRITEVPQPLASHFSR